MQMVDLNSNSTILYHGNCLEVMAAMPENSMDAIVTDPPYELGFMGKSWDNAGIAYNTEMWKQALRVLKPGGHLLAFGGTRTYHRMTVAIEDAGFEIRDSIHWIYGSGFPKSMDVSKAIDKAAGAEREVVGYDESRARPNRTGKVMGEVPYDRSDNGATQTAPATPEAAEWAGWGTALKPAHEPVVVARKPLEGTVAANVLKYRTGALNIDGTRIGRADGDVSFGGYGNGGIGMGSTGNSQGEGKGAEWVASTEGRWPANIVLGHNEDCKMVGEREDNLRAGERTANFGTQETISGGNGSGQWGERSLSVGVWECTEGCPIKEFPDTASTGNGTATGFRKGGASENSVGLAGKKKAADGHNDGGSASRYFKNIQPDAIDTNPPFIYCAKPPKKEKNAGLDHLPERKSDTRSDTAAGIWANMEAPKQNFHPTVKPIALMRWLVRLVTPPGGLVLDPFLGSGTTAVAAILEGVKCVGIEMTEDYLPIIAGRVAWAEGQVVDRQGDN